MWERARCARWSARSASDVRGRVPLEMIRFTIDVSAASRDREAKSEVERSRWCLRLRRAGVEAFARRRW
jgi:hypothetical protein